MNSLGGVSPRGSGRAVLAAGGRWLFVIGSAWDELVICDVHIRRL